MTAVLRNPCQFGGRTTSCLIAIEEMVEGLKRTVMQRDVKQLQLPKVLPLPEAE